jgi:hypothetical protein
MKFPAGLFIALGISIVLISCREHEPTEGGPCKYKITKSAATIIEIQRNDSASAEILFSVINQSGPDTIYYTRYFPGFATNADIEKYDLRIGNQFVYEEHEITEGTCSPYFYRLTLEKYK